MVVRRRMGGSPTRGWGTRARWRMAVPLCVALLLGGCGEESPVLVKGEPTPPFALTALSGETITFPADLRGQVVAVRFWADWCPFCKGEMRALEPIDRAYRDRGLRLLAINVRQDRKTAAAFVAPLGITYEVLLDEDGEVARAYGVSGLPTTFFLDRQGRLVTRLLGESTPEVFEQLVKGLL